VFDETPQRSGGREQGCRRRDDAALGQHVTRHARGNPRAATRQGKRGSLAQTLARWRQGNHGGAAGVAGASVVARLRVRGRVHVSSVGLVLVCPDERGRTPTARSSAGRPESRPRGVHACGCTVVCACV
jgi:hypothetical protein